MRPAEERQEEALWGTFFEKTPDALQLVVRWERGVVHGAFWKLNRTLPLRRSSGTIILEAGHEVVFYPKFNCELNYIGYYGGALKKYTREL